MNSQGSDIKKAILETNNNVKNNLESSNKIKNIKKKKNNIVFHTNLTPIKSLREVKKYIDINKIENLYVIRYGTFKKGEVIKVVIYDKNHKREPKEEYVKDTREKIPNIKTLYGTNEKTKEVKNFNDFKIQKEIEDFKNFKAIRKI